MVQEIYCAALHVKVSGDRKQAPGNRPPPRGGSGKAGGGVKRENKIDDETLFDILDNKLKTGKKFSLEEIDAAIAQGYVDAGMKGLE